MTRPIIREFDPEAAKRERQRGMTILRRVQDDQECAREATMSGKTRDIAELSRLFNLPSETE